MKTSCQENVTRIFTAIICMAILGAASAVVMIPAVVDGLTAVFDGRNTFVEYIKMGAGTFGIVLCGLLIKDLWKYVWPARISEERK